MLNKKVTIYNAIFFGICGLFSLVFGLTGLGAMAVIFGAINVFISLIYFISKRNDKAKTCLLIGGLLLLSGFALCSNFPLDFH